MSVIRPCYLVVDPEHGGALSTRKLVLETAKLNVITAYSSAEAIETLRKFPALDGVVVDTSTRDMPCSDLVAALKAVKPDVPIVVVGAPRQWECTGADSYLVSYHPVALLEQIKELQRPAVEAIEARDAKLSAEGT